MSESNLIYEPVRALYDVVSIFDSLKIPYFLVGSFASGIRGEFRATNDLDFVCNLDLSKGSELTLATAEDFYSCVRGSINQTSSTFARGTRASSPVSSFALRTRTQAPLGIWTGSWGSSVTSPKAPK